MLGWTGACRCDPDIKSERNGLIIGLMEFGSAPDQSRRKMFQLENHSLKNNPPGNGRLAKKLNKLARREARRKADEIRRGISQQSPVTGPDNPNMFLTKRTREIIRL